jgi:hypothetical protein
LRAAKALLWSCCAFALAACQSPSPQPFFQLAPEAAAHKAAQTRHFETKDADELLSASAAVLQDLGFHVEESVPELGFLRAAKERSAMQNGQLTARGFLLVFSLGRVLMPVDLQQQIVATLVARPTDTAGTRHEVRVLFHRVVWKGDGVVDRNYIAPGEQRMEMVRDPLVYQLFFAKLAKAVFLEAFTL